MENCCCLEHNAEVMANSITSKHFDSVVERHMSCVHACDIYHHLLILYMEFVCSSLFEVHDLSPT